MFCKLDSVRVVELGAENKLDERNGGGVEADHELNGQLANCVDADRSLLRCGRCFEEPLQMRKAVSAGSAASPRRAWRLLVGGVLIRFNRVEHFGRGGEEDLNCVSKSASAVDLAKAVRARRLEADGAVGWDDLEGGDGAPPVELIDGIF